MGVVSYNSVGGYSTGLTMTGVIDALGNITGVTGTFTKTLTGTTSNFTGLVSSTVGFSGPGTNITGVVTSFNNQTGAVTGVTVGGTNVFTALNSFSAGISAAGGVTLAGTLQGTTAAFTGLVSSTVGFSGPGTNITGVVTSFNNQTGAVTGVTVGGTNVFTALNTFNAGISAAGGTFSSQTRFLAGITVAGGATFGTDISVFGIRVGRGNQGATNGGDTNLAVGANTLNVVVPNPASFLGIYNLAFGTSALQNTTSGGYNSAFGTEALLTNTSGGGNIAFGVHALRLNTTGVENCAFGGGPMYQNTTGGYNVSIGSLSYYYKSTGSYNVAIGYQAGYNYGTPSSGNAVTSATNCTLIGTYATPLTSGTSNEIVIGYNAIGKGSDTVVLGNSSITSTDLRGVVNNPSGLSAAGATFSSNVSVGGNLTVTGTIVGNQEINAQTGTTYSLVLSDSGKLVTLNNASGITMTFPTYASVGITTGAVVYFAQLGAGTVGFTGAAGVSVRTTPGLFLRTQYSTASAIKIATNEWLISGDMTA